MQLDERMEQIEAKVDWVENSTYEPGGLCLSKYTPQLPGSQSGPIPKPKKTIPKLLSIQGAFLVSNKSILAKKVFVPKAPQPLEAKNHLDQIGPLSSVEIPIFTNSMVPKMGPQHSECLKMVKKILNQPLDQTLLLD